MYRRSLFDTLLARLTGRRRFLQFLSGPRQSGKTTLSRQVCDSLKIPYHYISADDPVRHSSIWLEEKWEASRIDARQQGAQGAVFVIDEIQKIPQWPEVLKRLWDEDTAAKVPLNVLVLGSAPLTLQRGLSESLAGRFEMLHSPHWSFREMRDAFGYSLDEYIVYGGYPGAADLRRDHDRWTSYVRDSLIEATISRDILHLTRIDKPALLRHLFHLACDSSGQVLSYQKMLGQLQDAGNTTTLAHYLSLLDTVGMICGLQKYAGTRVRQRGSSPKLLVHNTALMTSQFGRTFEELRGDLAAWGRFVESAVGAHILNAVRGTTMELFYWREGEAEVDFVIRRGNAITAIEVKSGSSRGKRSGMQAFAEMFKPKRILLVGQGGISIEKFLSEPLMTFVA